MLQNKKGFSLLEILIYTGLIAIVGTLLSGILISVMQLGNQQSASTEVNQQLNFVLQTIQRLVRDSSLVDMPSATATSSLVLRMKTPSEDPTRIYISSNKVYLQQGAGGTPAPLTNDQVLVNNLNFVKISAYPGHDSVQVDLALSYNTQNPEQSFTKSLSSAVARVSAATFDSDVVPGSTNSYDIGLSTTRWKNLYLSGNLTVGNLVTLGNSTSDPSGTNGAIYYNTASNKFRGYQSGAWADLGGGIPAGTINTYAGSTAPSGWLEANGAAISRTTYAVLYAAIGNSFGPGDGSTTFNLPDLRGVFVRGWDHGAGRDPDAASRTALLSGGATGNNVGSYQADEFKSHTHTIKWLPNDGAAGNNKHAFEGPYLYTTSAAGGNETRPKNVYLMYIIKY